MQGIMEVNFIYKAQNHKSHLPQWDLQSAPGAPTSIPLRKSNAIKKAEGEKKWNNPSEEQGSLSLVARTRSKCCVYRKGQQNPRSQWQNIW